MILIKKLNINIFYIKKYCKINKNYLKNIKLISEIIKKNKYFILINHAFTGSHHFKGIFIKNFKNKGWFNLTLKNIKSNKISIICINNINSNFGSTNNKCKNPLNLIKYNKNFIKIKFINLIKIKIIILKKLKIENLIKLIGGSFGGVEILLWFINYPEFINFYLVISCSLYLSMKNLILNKINNFICNFFKNINNKYYTLKYKNLKQLKLSRVINYISYLSYYELEKKNYKNKKNINNYINYNSNKFINIFNINNIIFYLNFLKIKNFNFINFYKNLFLIFFEKDPRYKINNMIKLLSKFLLYTKINIFSIKNKEGHDGFLKNNLIYLNILSLYLNVSGW